MKKDEPRLAALMRVFHKDRYYSAVRHQQLQQQSGICSRRQISVAFRRQLTQHRADGSSRSSSSELERWTTGRGWTGRSVETGRGAMDSARRRRRLSSRAQSL